MNTLLQQLFLGREPLIVHPQPGSRQLWQEQGFSEIDVLFILIN